MRLLLAMLAVLSCGVDLPAQEDAADANAGADVTVEPRPADAEPASTENAEEAEAVAPTVQRMRYIESLPLIVPDEAQPPTPAATPESMDVKAALRNRMNDLLAEPAPRAGGRVVQSQLIDLTNNASQLALLSDPGPEQFEALSVQMQALYAQITEASDTMEIDRLLSRLRSAARRTKAIPLPSAKGVGDFWLMTAELFDLNRTPLSVEARREQAAALMAEYIEDHPEAGPTESVRTAYIDLQQARGIEVDAAAPFSRDPQQSEGERETDEATPATHDDPSPPTDVEPVPDE